MTQENNYVFEIKNKDDYNEFKRKHELGVVLYGAKWCPGCIEIYPLYIRIANRYRKKIALAYADIDVINADFTTIPYFVTLYKENIVDTMEGGCKELLKRHIKKALKYKEEKEVLENEPKVLPEIGKITETSFIEIIPEKVSKKHIKKEVTDIKKKNKK